MKFPMIRAMICGQDLPITGMAGMSTVEFAVKPKEE